MNAAENALAVLRYQQYDAFPVVCFGWWPETLKKWEDEGHLPAGSADEYARLGDNCTADRYAMDKLGFDFGWGYSVSGDMAMRPLFEEKVLRTEDDGSIVKMDQAGLIVRVVPGVISIPAEIGTALTGREAWEELYLPKLRFTPDRVDTAAVRAARARADETGSLLAVYGGSMIGLARNICGLVGLSYLYADDRELYCEVVHTLADLQYKVTEAVLATGVRFDYMHLWEDIACKSGPLVTPRAFEKIVCPEYVRITELARRYGLDIVDVDCDGVIDRLVPGWIASGVNTMFPVEVGTWNADFVPWREKYGRELRAVGGMRKHVFAEDKKAVDEEIERLRRLIDLGGYIPCPDHRIAPDADFSLVAYYCEQMHKLVK